MSTRSDDLPPASMSELKATDAALDRLAAGHCDQSDLADPVLSMLADLVQYTRQGESSAVAGSLSEQLADAVALSAALHGRPLWLLPDDPADSEIADCEIEADSEILDLDDPAWAPPRLIDLTGRPEPHRATDQRPVAAVGADAAAVPDPDHPGASHDQPSDGEAPDDRDGAGVGGPIRPIRPGRPFLPAARRPLTGKLTELAGGKPNPARPVTGRPSRASHPAAGRPRGQRSASRPGSIRSGSGNARGGVGPQRHVLDLPDDPFLPPSRRTRQRSADLPLVVKYLPLPVAVAIAVFVLGTGVSAAVTGDPMAPLTSVSRLVSQLNGDDNVPPGEKAKTSVQQKINAAGVAVDKGQFDKARVLLNAAKSDLSDVRGSDHGQLQTQITQLTNQVPQVPVGASTIPTQTPSVPVTPSVLPTDQPSASATPTDSPTPTESATETTDPTPSDTSASPTTTDPTPTEQPSDEPTDEPTLSP